MNALSDHRGLPALLGPLLLAAAAACVTQEGGERNPQRARVPEHVSSPDGRLVVTLSLDPVAAAPRLTIALDGRELVSAKDLGLDFADAPPFGTGLELVDQRSEVREEAYDHAFGKRRALVDRCSAMVWTLRERTAPERTAELELRVHDDGVSYRWRVLAWPTVARARVAAERVLWTLAENPRAFPLYRASFRTSHEGPYAEARANELVPERLIDLPLLLEHDDGRCLAFAEADVRGYPHAYLLRPTDSDPESATELALRLSPRIDEPAVAARVVLPFQTPWRTWMIGESIAQLLESDLLIHLCEPSRIVDPTWIVPDKQTWHWWNGTVLAADDQGCGMDHDTMLAYVDFCARSGIRYHAVTGQDVPWYVQSRRSVLPSPDADVLTPRAELRWDELRAEAAERGVELRLWVHHEALRPKLEEAFALYGRWGVSGVMVDFLNRDDQEMVEFCERVLQLAAEHHLTVQFHGSFKPTGLQRTYPNLMNHEGSANLEVLKWAATCDPDHDLLVPFTRGLAGPLDYHLGGFRSLRRSEFEPRYIRPWVLGTRARALAWYVVLENPLPMVCDYPQAYTNQQGFDFLVEVPTVWDESRVLSAAIGEHLVWARRSGSRWYLGAVTDWTPRELELPLDFLGPGQHELHLFADPEAPDADPNELVESRRRVTAGDHLHLRLAAGGGAVAVFD